MQISGSLRNLAGAFMVASLAFSTAGLAEEKKSATYAMYTEIKDWDPAVAFSTEVIMLANVYELLLYYNPPGSEQQFRPGLATAWTVSEDGLTWTFTLREGVSFHDGEPFNAAAAKASLDRTRSLGKGASFIWASVEEISAPDDTTLVIKTKTPQPIDLIASAQYAAYMVSPKAAEKGTAWFNEGNAAGTGPYRVRQWVKGQQVVLEKFPEYWGGWGEDSFERVFLKTVTENATQVQMLKSGEADLISLVPADAMESLNAEEGITTALLSSWMNSMYLINVAKAPTDNLKFRQALTLIWDYESVVNDIYAGSATVARGPVPASMWGHNPKIEAPKQNLERARQLIEESGVPEAQRKVTMAFIGTSEEYKNSALLFQALAAEVGVEVELLPGEWTVIWDKAKNQETAPNLQSMTWWPTYATPSDWLIGLFRSEDPTLFNLSHYANPAYDKLVDEGVSLEGSDRDQAIADYGKAQEMLVEGATAIFYADIMTRTARRSNLQGLVANPAYATVFFHQLSRAD
ncbi:MAG: ABC transporter substrate-binding protein [Kiloniellales bacterium]